MKRALVAVFAAIVLSSTGCRVFDGCRDGIFRDNGHLDQMRADNGEPYHVGHPGLCHKAQPVALPGPMTPTYGYPYYTLRGPRDFLVDNPPSIGR